ncbi:hypothetical protein [Nonomuraea dietziae]|uniref:hypothetical protein n=1 Tax=Nonomuraea dietziae TaxID=65515 RepID=UPI0031E1521B
MTATAQQGLLSIDEAHAGTAQGATRAGRRWGRATPLRLLPYLRPLPDRSAVERGRGEIWPRHSQVCGEALEWAQDAHDVEIIGVSIATPARQRSAVGHRHSGSR